MGSNIHLCEDKTQTLLFCGHPYANSKRHNFVVNGFCEGRKKVNFGSEPFSLLVGKHPLQIKQKFPPLFQWTDRFVKQWYTHVRKPGRPYGLKLAIQTARFKPLKEYGRPGGLVLAININSVLLQFWMTLCRCLVHLFLLFNWRRDSETLGGKLVLQCTC